MNFAVLIGVWFILLGVYSFYFAESMKKTGTIKAGWLVSKSIQLSECKDIPGYIADTYPKTIGFASAVVVLGVLVIIGEAISLRLITALSILALGCLYFWYWTMMSRAEKKYLSRK